MLLIAKKMEVYSTKFTDMAVQVSHLSRIAINKGALNYSNHQEGQFDIITFFEVIENINSYNKELSNFHYLLRKGGLPNITTPNFNSIYLNRLKEKLSIIEYPEH